MDEIVKQAMAKWPHVPHCYGWLGLDARGDWYLRDAATQAAGPFAQVKGERIEHDKLHLRKLKGALRRINEGDFGYCESCGDEISLKRLQARPESRFCVECQSTKEFNDTHVFRRVA